MVGFTDSTRSRPGPAVTVGVSTELGVVNSLEKAHTRCLDIVVQRVGFSGDPKENRTPVSGVRGQRPNR